jgi:ABC-type Fe3+-hydroxamate transport system substrate-binding protein
VRSFASVRRALGRAGGLAITLAVGVALAGCDRARAPEQGAAQGGAAGTVDDFGNTLAFTAPAQRVVSLNPVATELIFALGAGDRLVGRTHWDNHPEAARLVADVGDGMMPNVEAVLGQRPDLVILYASASNRTAAAQLATAGVRTIAFRTDHVSDLARVTPVIAAALGVADAGSAVVDSVLASIDAVRALPAPAKRLRAFWHVWDAPLITIGQGSYLSELLEAAAGENVFADLDNPSPQVTLEEIARRDPDVILVGPNSAVKLRAHPGWAAVRAVREGRVLIVDTMLVGRPGVRMGEAARHLRQLLYPEGAR